MKFTTIIGFVCCTGLGLFAGCLAVYYWPVIKQHLTVEPPLYLTSNETLQSSYTTQPITSLSWTALLPEKEQKVIADYQTPATNLNDMTAQVLRSIKASSDENYQQALNSTNTVSHLDNLLVSISGFIVPIDFYDDKSVQHFFLVPYFGACLHFPPPPPNQMLFVRLEPGFSKLDIAQAYTLTGTIRTGLFEDPMGTSAYILEPISVTKFYGQPDDFRTH